MSVFNALDSVSNLLPSTLSFNYGDLEVLLDSLYHYNEKLNEENDDPNKPLYLVADGRSHLDVCNELIQKFINYNFK